MASGPVGTIAGDIDDTCSAYLTVILFSYFLSKILGPFVFSGPNYRLLSSCVCVVLFRAFFWFGPQVGFHSLKPITGPI